MRLGSKHSLETRAKMSAARIGKIPTALTRKKISAIHKGKKVSEETRRKIGLASIGRTHTMSEEGKKKISATHKGKKVSEESKKKMSIAQRKWRKNVDPKIFGRGKKGVPLSKEHRRNIGKGVADAIVEGKMNPEKRHWHTGDFWSEKNGKMVHYRSQLELDWYKHLEQIDKVRHYYVEPCVIPYKFEGVQCYYVPDLRIRYMNKTTELVEIKPEWEQNSPRNKAKFQAAKKWCKTRKVVTTFRTLGYEELKTGTVIEL